MQVDSTLNILMADFSTDVTRAQQCVFCLLVRFSCECPENNES